MVLLADQLMWELTKKHNCFLYKMNGQKDRVGAIALSKDPSNVKSLHKYKYSGIANSKAVNVTTDAQHRIKLITKSASKADKTVAIRKAGVRSGFAQAAAVIQKQTAGVFYRRDLLSAVLAKYSKVYRASRRAKGITKPIKVKMGRGTLHKPPNTKQD